MRRPIRLLATMAAAAVVAAACSGGGEGEQARSPSSTDVVSADGGGPRVVVTTTILGDVVRDVAGSDARVEVLMRPGQDPHGFSPSARQAASLREADVVVANGLELEASILDVLAAAEEDGADVLRLAEELEPRTFDGEPASHDEDEHGQDEGEHAHDENEHAHDEEDESDHAEHADEDEHAHGHGPQDPHVWFDPVRMADGARLIADHLATVDDALSDDEWAARGDTVAEEILDAHEEVQRTLAAVPEPCRQLVTNHDAFGYLAERYGFEVVGTVVPGTSTQADPSAQEFAALAETLRDSSVPAIFAETTQSTRLAESLAGEVGRDIEIVELYTGSLGEPGSGAETYTGLLLTNAERIADALASC